jgi:hypothetical protein
MHGTKRPKGGDANAKQRAKAEEVPDDLPDPDQETKPTNRVRNRFNSIPGIINRDL